MAIQIKKSHEGRLKAKLGTITEAKLEAAKNSPDAATRKQATFAENARHWNHRKGLSRKRR